MKNYIRCRQTMWVLVAVLMVFAGTSQAVEVKLSGQINRAVMWADNGDESDVLHVDNDSSSTRFRLVGDQQVSDMVKVGVRWETQFESNTSASVDIDQNDDGESAFTERKLEAFFELPYGTFTIGQGPGAADATSEVDLSGTSVIMYNDPNVTAGGLTFRDGDGNFIGDPDDPTAVGDTRSNFDGLSRNDRLQYDSPEFSGFTVSTSTTNGGAWELAGRYSADYGEIGKVAAAIGYVDTDDRGSSEFSQVGSSISWLHTTGVNLTLGYGSRDPEDGDNDPVSYYGKVGYLWGIHAVAVEYGLTEDLQIEGDESSNYGLAYVAAPWSGVELYGTYRAFELDRDGVSDIEDIRQLMVGTRVKF